MDSQLALFGVLIDDYTKESLVKRILECLANGQERLFIVTLNPEILLLAEKDAAYKKILNIADIRLIDGTGIRLVARLKQKRVGERMAGADLADLILRQGERKKICCVMREDGLSAKENLTAFFSSHHPRVHAQIIAIPTEYRPDELAAIHSDTEVLLVGLGAPFQERLIFNVMDRLPNLKLAVGVGGTFDYWTGRKRRAPSVIRKIGFEWLWRLIIQPNRLNRIANATIFFLYKTIR